MCQDRKQRKNEKWNKKNKQISTLFSTNKEREREPVKLTDTSNKTTNYLRKRKRSKYGS